MAKSEFQFRQVLTVIFFGIAGAATPAQSAFVPAHPLGYTPLLQAAIKGKVSEVRNMLKVGASPMERDSRGTPTLLSAISLTVPMDRKSQLENRGGSSSPIIESIYWMIRATPPEMLEFKDQDAVGDRRNALQMAASTGAVPVLKWLLAVGVQVDSTNQFGETALYLAAEKGHLEAVQVLLAAGAQINHQTVHTKMTPLMAASKNFDYRVVMELLKNGAERRFRNAFGKSAEDLFEEARLNAGGHRDMRVTKN